MNANTSSIEPGLQLFEMPRVLLFINAPIERIARFISSQSGIDYQQNIYEKEISRVDFGVFRLTGSSWTMFECTYSESISFRAGLAWMNGVVRSLVEQLECNVVIYETHREGDDGILVKCMVYKENGETELVLGVDGCNSKFIELQLKFPDIFIGSPTPISDAYLYDGLPWIFSIYQPIEVSFELSEYVPLPMLTFEEAEVLSREQDALPRPALPSSAFVRVDGFSVSGWLDEFASYFHPEIED